MATISVKDYLAAYKPAYDAVKADGTRKRGEKAYENLFAVGDRTDDMQEAQLIIEKEGLMMKLVTEDALDIHENTLKKLDPLDEVTNVLTKLNIEMYRNAKSNEDIKYQSKLIEMKTIELTAKGKIKMLLAVELANELIKYDSAKRKVREWPDDGKAKAALAAMAQFRNAVRSILDIAREELGKEWPELLEEQFFMIWMLVPKNKDGYGRVKETMHPDAMLAYRDLITEILSDDSLADILKKEQEHAMCYLPE